MKKLISIMLVLCMMVTVMPMAFAGELTELEITDVKYGYKAFYSNGQNNNYNSVDSAAGVGALLRKAGEWVSYDVSSLAEGTYELTIDLQNPSANQAIAGIYIDGTLNILYKFGQIGDSSWNSDREATVLGNVYIPNGAQEIKIKNDGGAQDWDFIRVHLKQISTEDIVSKDIRRYASNISHKEDYTDDEAYADGATTGGPGATEYREGEDYYISSASDNFGGGSGSGNYTVSDATSNILLRGTDWARYDLEGMRQGTYNIKMYAGTGTANQTMRFEIDGREYAVATMPNYGYYTYPDETALETLCKLYISDSAEFLKITSSAGCYIKYIDFEYLSAEDTTDAASITYTNIYTTNGSSTYLATEDDYTKGNYYDSAGTGVQVHNTGVMLYANANEWVKYDISKVPAGIYDVSLYADVRPKVDAGTGDVRVLIINASGQVIDEGIIYYTGGTKGTFAKSTSTCKSMEITDDAAYVVFRSGTGDTSVISYTFDGSYKFDTAFTSDAEGNTAISEIGANTTVYAQVDLANSTPSKDVTVIVAVYNGDELVSATPEKDIRVAKSTEVSKTYTIPVKAGEDVKVFIWDNLTNISPLAGAAVIE